MATRAASALDLIAGPPEALTRRPPLRSSVSVWVPVSRVAGWVQRAIPNMLWRAGSQPDQERRQLA